MISKVITFMLPILPKKLVQTVSKRYIAGVTKDDAFKKIKYLNSLGFHATIDILGENVKNKEEAIHIKNGYIELLEGISEHNIKSNISIKLTNLGINFDYNLALDIFLELCEKAKKYNNFIRIDMEDSSLTDKTLEIYKKAIKDYTNIGVVLQAYLYRSMNDLHNLINKVGTEKLNIRLCKGIYNEPKSIAIKSRKLIRNNFLELAKLMLDNGVYIGIATHDLYLINNLKKYIMEKNIPKDKYEFQALLGVPITNILKKLINEGIKVRIYVPFGERWYEYSLRRLKENPKIAGYIAKAIFKKTIYED